MNPSDSPFQVAFGCYDILNHILTFVTKNNASGYGRVENMELSCKIISISKIFRRWYFFSKNGPYQFTAKVYNDFLGEGPCELRFFLGHLNQDLARKAKIAFDYIQVITQKRFHGNLIELYPKDINMNVRDYEGLSPLDRLIPRVLANPARYGPVLNKLLKELAPPVICRALTHLFSVDNKYSYERYITLADDLIERAIEKTGSAQLALDALQPLLPKILLFKTSCILRFYHWIKNKGFIFTVDNVADCFSRTLNLWQNRVEFLCVMEDILNSKDVVIHAPTSQGDHPIHRIMETSNDKEDRKQYMQMVLKKDPNAVFAKNKKGLTPLLYLASAINHELLETLRPYLDERALWDQREECHQFIYKWLSQGRLERYRFNPYSQDDVILGYFNKLKQLFSGEETFVSWLSTPWKNGKCLLHEMAIWSSSLISDLFQAGFFSSAMFSAKFSYNYTLLEIQGLHLKLLRSEGRTDLKEVVELAKELIDPAFLFGLFENQFFSYGNPFLLRSLLEITGVAIADDQGNTLLHQILKRRYVPCEISNMQAAISFMLDLGLDPELRNHKGETVKDIAIKEGWISNNSSIRCLIGDQIYVRIAKKSFDYIEAVTKSSFQRNPLELYPDEMSTDVIDYENQTPLDSLIPSLFLNPPLYAELFDQLLQVSRPSVIAQGLCHIFLRENPCPLETALEFAERCFALIEHKTGLKQLAIEALQPHLSKILFFKSGSILPAYHWIKRNGFIFSADNLFECFSMHIRAFDDIQAFLEVLIEILPSVHILGNHPIHAILTNPNLGNERKTYLQLILEKDPNACFATNEKGTTALFFLHKEYNHGLVEILKPYLGEAVLSLQRVECQKRILNWLAENKVHNKIFAPNDTDQDILEYLKIIKSLFASGKKFEEWLVEPWENGDSFLHELAIWSSDLIDEMYQQNFFSEDLFSKKNFLNHTLSEIQNLHRRFRRICEGEQDLDGLKATIRLMPYIWTPRFIFDLCNQQFFLNGNSHLLGFILKIKRANMVDEKGDTLLHKVLSRPFNKRSIPQMKSAIAFIMDHGIDPLIENEDGKTPRDIAVENGWECVLEMIR